MKKLLLCFVVVLSLQASAQEEEAEMPVLTTEKIYEKRGFDHYKSHWISSFGFDALKYEVPFEFQGARKNLKPKDEALYGGRVGLGREFYLGKGIFTTSTVEGFFVGTLFEEERNAQPDVSNSTYSKSKKTGQVFGADISQSLGFMFNLKTKNPFLNEITYLTVQPYVDAGIGLAKAYQRRTYDYNTGPSGVQESYRMQFEDQILTRRLGIGVNITSNQGYFLYLKGSIYNYDVTKREIRGYTQADRASRVDITSTDKSVKLDPMVVYAIGGGYKF